ncbi:chemotaxis protein CheD [Methylomonas montana]|uniref:chemotaxis protein CheD n=1 Tax=Methylomonas montana TaxID=3058963 RepID=UPI00265AF77B|nr:chemotaxis protein CheD [Methylomonas montana]WKJ92484.1 chemotaxis protein CheD [Methylomonas montana]
MKALPFKNTRRIIIEPGEFYASRQAEVISTLLGSCVAACLFDPINRVFGMNHFLLAYRHQAHNTPIIESNEGRYGIYAMELLINEMMKLGANRLNLKAKCFGGGNVLKLREDGDNKKTIGDVNVLFIKEFLKKENIPMLSACLGGTIGRNVHFVGSDYSVFVKKIDSSQQQLLENEERRYWKKNIDEHEKSGGTAEFW